MIALGDWMPTEPMQGVTLDRLHGDLYHIQAVGIMSGLQPDAIPAPGVMRYQSNSVVYNAIAKITERQIKGFAMYYNGVAIKTQSGWIIKAIAPKMRMEK